ncbi:hypothetical protein JCM8097_005308 [Rhodosporidiobolus ruineniae]
MASSALFRNDSDSEPDAQPPPKKARFFNDSDDDDEDSKPTHLDDDQGDAKVATRSAAKGKGRAHDTSTWGEKYFGEVFVRAFASASRSTFVRLKSGDKVTLTRIKPKKLDEAEKGAKAKNKKSENNIVRFANERGIEIGQVKADDAAWLAKLMDLDLLRVEGYCVHIDENFRSGSDISLSLTIYLRRTAFINPNKPKPPPSAPSTSTATSSASAGAGEKKSAPTFTDSLLETASEKALRERKKALNTLFDKADLQPIPDPSSSSAEAGEGKEGKGKGKQPAGSQSKRVMLRRMERSRAGEGGSGGDDEEEDEMSEIQLNLVYSKAIKNDSSLPERSPPPSFALNLRPYQRQALHWMSAMETGEADARKSLSLHPLFERYRFPREPGSKAEEDGEEFFYYNPYSGDLSLIFPRASTKCRGGILADEMGLGKTIMVASLLHTNTPWNVPDEPDLDAIAGGSGGDGLGGGGESSEESDGGRDRKRRRVVGATQTRLNAGQPSSSADSSSAAATANASTSTAPTDSIYSLPRRPKLPTPSTPRATLVVAPMTLLAQWCDELERTCVKGRKGAGLRVEMYYGSGRESGESLRREIEAGNVDVVVTSYGCVQSDYKQSGFDTASDAKKAAEDKDKDKVKAEDGDASDEDGSADKKKKKKKADGGGGGGKKKPKGLFAIEWFRIVLDEAHLIKSRTTLTAKSTYALRGARRWALTGTPIVNRLEDLYSLLRFIQLEPWGNFSFFKTFVTVPFQNKDPRAIEVIQVILESILLRREKSMKDKDGQPIVPLPPKHVQLVSLDFSPDERAIYSALFRNAKSKFLGYAREGTVLSNVTAIFAILMRLRQAVLHPSLVLKRLKEKLNEQGVKKRAASPSEPNGVDELDERDIQRMIERFTKGEDLGLSVGSGGAGGKAKEVASQAIDDLLEVKDEDQVGEGDECPLCLEPFEIPIWMPRCGHSGCKGCVLSHLEDLQNAGEEPRCPICRSGPLTERELAAIQNADGTRPARSSSPKKKKYAVETLPSSPGSTSSGAAREVLTLLDTDSEDDKTPSPVKKKVAAPAPSLAAKGKGKAKAEPEEIVLDSSSDDDKEDESDYADSDAPSDDVLPAGTRRRLRRTRGDAKNSDGDAKMGDLRDSDDSSSAEDDDADAAEDGPAVDYAGEAAEVRKRKALVAQGDFRSSTKLEALVKSLKEAKAKDPKLKAVVFSYFTAFIDLIERKLSKEGIYYLRLDGTQSQAVRQKVVRKFTKSEQSVVFLASTKAGGVGLNLVAADHVYLTDTWWNVATEQQAIDRIHRFGQTRPVYVTRILISPSIDDKLVAIQERKTKVIQSALGSSKEKDRKQLAEDLAAIFADDA